MKSYFEQIYPFMEQSGINKSKLAEIAGVRTSAVTKWVQGGAIRIGQLKKIADYFGVDIRELMPTESSLSVRESENTTVEYWRRRALDAEAKLKHVKEVIGKLQETVK